MIEFTNSAGTYLDCGCFIAPNGTRALCPTCAYPPPRPLRVRGEVVAIAPTNYPFDEVTIRVPMGVQLKTGQTLVVEWEASDAHPR